MQRPHPAQKQEMMNFHAADYVEFLQRVTPENSKEFLHQLQKCAFLLLLFSSLLVLFFLFMLGDGGWKGGEGVPLTRVCLLFCSFSRAVVFRAGVGALFEDTHFSLLGRSIRSLSKFCFFLFSSFFLNRQSGSVHGLPCV